ncbi:hypothetical protein GGX14DRAFT_379917 [Mycena pura]|uniref:Uncharacterized protein n=1 Tax=Mycena pura TaxID=153505 RepID=A0AAD6USG8_9AGAR|nr:hypothetical protein GGX14DRAFT_379917 [Mycena pura]
MNNLDGIDDTNPATFRPPPSPKPPKRARLENIPKRNHHRHAKRRDKRNTAPQTPRPATLRDCVSDGVAIHATLDAFTLPTTHGAYAAKAEDSRSKYGHKKRRTLSELIALGFRVVKWDGIEARPIVDAHDRVIAVLAGRPRDPTYVQAVSDVFNAMLLERKNAHFPGSLNKHRRGSFPALNAGLSYSKGQRVPSRLDGGEYALLLQRLLGDPNVNRMAVYASAAFALWAPKVHRYYQEHDDALHRKMPDLGRNFAKSVFSCAAFNFGPKVCTFKHRDILNVPFGWCAVTAMGEFDHRTGGHLVLWDLELVVEFPHAATILLPSATIAHSNIPVGVDEMRGSFTQYTPGGLIRYVDNGFRTEGELQEEDPAEYARLLALKATRWDMGISLLSTVEELLEAL